MSLDDHAMMRLEGETFVQAELLRRKAGLTDAELKAFATGMIGGICDVLAARFGTCESGIVELPPIDGQPRLVWSRDNVTIATGGPIMTIVSDPRNSAAARQDIVALAIVNERRHRSGLRPLALLEHVQATIRTHAMAEAEAALWALRRAGCEI